MPDGVDAFCARYRYPGDQPWVRPAYAGESIINLSRSILAHFGAAHEEPLSFHREFSQRLRGRRKVILLVLDGMGWRNLERAAQRRPVIRDICAQAYCHPLTSVFPSTTSAAMTSYVSGLPPAQHGIIGFIRYFPEYARIFNMLSFRTPDLNNEDLLSFGFDPATYIGRQSVLHGVETTGAMVSAYVFRGYAGSGLSRLLYHDTQLHTYVALGDLLAMSLSQLRAAVPQFVFLYWSSLDTIAHTHGADSEAYAIELAMIWTAIRENLLPVLDGETALLISADHGHIDGDDNQAINLMAMPDVLRELRVPPAGEGRALHLFVQSGSEGRVRRRLEETGEIRVLMKDEFLRSGLLGNPPVRPGLDEYIGDVIGIPHGSRRILYDYQPRPHTAMVGRHGGMTVDEMVVPLFVF